MQRRPDIMAHYAALKQPLIKYPPDIIELDANDAVEKYTPDVVIGTWVTQKCYLPTEEGNYWGFKEDLFKGKVKKYIFIGNRATHGRKKILKLFPHKTYQFDWLVTRSMQKDKNVIYVFDCE